MTTSLSLAPPPAAVASPGGRLSVSEGSPPLPRWTHARPQASLGTLQENKYGKYIIDDTVRIQLKGCASFWE